MSLDPRNPTTAEQGLPSHQPQEGFLPQEEGSEEGESNVEGGCGRGVGKRQEQRSFQ